MSTAGPEREVADWIYAGDLTRHLGRAAACMVVNEATRVARNGDRIGTTYWKAILEKVDALLHAQLDTSRH
ncbi:hypothetical protein [Sphingobium sp.]|uniref:hypothetical protein n=1 Tax=Sphingobium sp. TaxID=1912891 RepID=UPI002BC80989|nr:hypothetical protein [Sphingobium sp.]HUD90083.1 hypothetical protein [Sphingobium sp.]